MSELIGNKPVKELLNRLVASGRLPGAMLFVGPDAVGKKLFALRLAQTLVCTKRTDNAACLQCSACKRAEVFSIPTFSRGEDSEHVFFSQHPDVGLVVPYNRTLRIGAIRALEREAYFRPYESSSRIFIIEDADKMNDAAANALLKTIEEPPSTSHVILIASRVDSLLPTIRSRCQMIRFAPVGFKEIEDVLIATGNFSPEDAAVAARASGGSVGRALEIVPASFRTQRSLMLEVLTSAVKGDIRELLAAAEEMNDAKNKPEYEEKIDVLRSLIHDIWLLRNGGEVAEIKNLEIAPDLRQLSDKSSSSVLARWLNDVESLQEALNVNINRKAATDALFVGMAA